jgi:hypothetical protein
MHSVELFERLVFSFEVPDAVVVGNAGDDIYPFRCDVFDEVRFGIPAVTKQVACIDPPVNTIKLRVPLIILMQYGDANSFAYQRLKSLLQKCLT